MLDSLLRAVLKHQGAQGGEVFIVKKKTLLLVADGYIVNFVFPYLIV